MNKLIIPIIVIIIIAGVSGAYFVFQKPAFPEPKPSDETLSTEICSPRGIYALDSKVGTFRDANIRDYPFVDGYAWRWDWSSFETSKGVYDFSPINHIINRLETIDKKLTILLGVGSREPAYIISTPGVTTYSYVDKKTKERVIRPVPWDPYAQERYRAFVKALGDHRIPNKKAGGALTPLRDHPVLANINLGIVGIGSIRDRGVKIADMPGYTREKFKNAVLSSLGAVVDNFPNKFVYLGFWRVTDENPSPELWEEIRRAILSKFDGVKNPRVGFWQENLAASRPNGPGTEPVIGRPRTDFAAPLYLSKDSTYIMFQALQGWDKPFANPEATANATPEDGIRYAHETYGSSYFELYVADLDNPKYWPSLQYWHDFFLGEEDPGKEDKSNFGIYQTMHRRQKEERPAAQINYPYLSGAYFIVSMIELEPEEGKFDFSGLDNLINLWKAKGKNIVLGIPWDWNFWLRWWNLYSRMGF